MRRGEGDGGCQIDPFCCSLVLVRSLEESVLRGVAHFIGCCKGHLIGAIPSVIASILCVSIVSRRCNDLVSSCSKSITPFSVQVQKIGSALSSKSIVNKVGNRRSRERGLGCYATNEKQAYLR